MELRIIMNNQSKVKANMQNLDNKRCKLQDKIIQMDNEISKMEDRLNVMRFNRDKAMNNFIELLSSEDRDLSLSNTLNVMLPVFIQENKLSKFEIRPIQSHIDILRQADIYFKELLSTQKQNTGLSNTLIDMIKQNKN